MIKRIDHVVITTQDPDRCLEFYRALGFQVEHRGGRYELFAGDFKINVHDLGSELSPHAQNVQPGSADICFEMSSSIDAYKAMLEAKGLTVELGVVPRNGTYGVMKSFYLRDPDKNLVEICSYEREMPQ